MDDILQVYLIINNLDRDRASQSARTLSNSWSSSAAVISSSGFVFFLIFDFVNEEEEEESVSFRTSLVDKGVEVLANFIESLTDLLLDLVMDITGFS